MRIAKDRLPRDRIGFTLAEILISSIVLAMMSIALLAFVKSGSDLWRRGQQKSNLLASARTVNELLSRDLSQAIKVGYPQFTAGSNVPGSYLEYDLPIVKGTTNGILTLRVSRATDGALKRSISSSPTFSYATSVSAETAVSLFKGRYEFTIARDCATFSVTRISSWSVQVDLGLQSIIYGDADTEGAINESTMTYLIPTGK